MSAPRTIALLGATGSIGASTLDIVARHPDRATAPARWPRVATGRRWRRCAAASGRDSSRCTTPPRPAKLARVLAGSGTEVAAGDEGLVVAVATLAEADTVLAAIVGAVGLPSTLAAARAGKRILLANKEALVMGGELFMDAVKAGGATLLPIDSEHNAIFQCLPPATSASALDARACARSSSPRRAGRSASARRRRWRT